MQSLPHRVFFTLTLWVTLLATTTHAFAWTEDFNGSFSKTWNASPGAFPSEYLWSPGNYGNVGTVNYSGNAPTGSFQTVGGAQTYQMTTEQPSLTRSAMASSDVFTGTQGYVEARFNTVTQDSQHIDAFVDLWLINATDPTKYVRAGLFGSDFSTNRGWNYSSSTDGSYFFGDVNYTNDTWYRVRIEATASQLHVSILNDAGNVEYAGHTFSHSLAALGSSFRVGIGQFIGGAGGTYINDVALDQITTTIPEPAALSIAGVVIGAMIMGRSRILRVRG